MASRAVPASAKSFSRIPDAPSFGRFFERSAPMLARAPQSRMQDNAGARETQPNPANSVNGRERFPPGVTLPQHARAHGRSGSLRPARFDDIVGEEAAGDVRRRHET